MKDNEVTSGTTLLVTVVPVRSWIGAILRFRPTSWGVNLRSANLSPDQIRRLAKMLGRERGVAWVRADHIQSQVGIQVRNLPEAAQRELILECLSRVLRDFSIGAEIQFWDELQDEMKEMYWAVRELMK